MYKNEKERKKLTFNWPDEFLNVSNWAIVPKGLNKFSKFDSVTFSDILLTFNVKALSEIIKNRRETIN